MAARFTKTTVEEARAMLAAHPMLMYLGFAGVSDDPRKQAIFCGYWYSQEKLDQKREQMLACLDEVDTCRRFLRPLPIQPRVSHLSSGSYGLKHQVEHWVDAQGLEHQYICNGSAILAALLERIPVHRPAARVGAMHNEPNALIGVTYKATQKVIDALRRERAAEATRDWWRKHAPGVPLPRSLMAS